MDLFHTDSRANLLPYGGEVIYYGRVIPLAQANKYFDKLMSTIEWKNDEAFIMGRHIITKRKVAWYGDSDYSYTYSNITKHAVVWTPELLELKRLSEQFTGSIYNSCLLNLYHAGDEGMAWHSDDEKALIKDGSIASISLGADRLFKFKHKETKLTIDTFLRHGSLLEMKGETQRNWLHRLPQTKKIHHPRINLTFRTMIKQ